MAKTNGVVVNTDLLKVDGTHTDIPLVGHTPTTAYSETYVCPKDVTFGFEIKFIGTTVRANIEIEQGNTAPVTEGAADVNMVVPDNIGYLIQTVTDSDLHVLYYAPVVTNFLRLKITSNAGNGADTVLERAVINTILNA